MKGTTALCLRCGKSFTKKNYRNMYCRTACRVQAHRQRHGIAEPDFPAMKQASLQSKLHQAEMQDKHNLFELLTRIERWESFPSHELEEMTACILAHPSYTDVYQERIDFQLHGTLPSASEIPWHIKTQNSEDKTEWDTATLDFWDYLEEDEQQMYIEAVRRYLSACRSFRDHHQRRNRIEKATQQVKACVQTILANVREELQDLNEEIKHIQATQQRRRALLSPETTVSNETEVTTNTPSSSMIITTARELAHKHTPPMLPLPESLRGLWGNIPTNPYIILWGDAGSGKTGFALKVLASLQKAGKGALCTSEASLESASSPLISLARAVKAEDVPLIQTHSIDAVETVLRSGSFSFLALDSASRLGLKADEVLSWRTSYPSMLLMVLLESTKSGEEFKGDNAWKHHCNIMVRATAVKNSTGLRTHGHFTIEKNQYGHYGELFL